jgi:hypothetical protein
VQVSSSRLVMESGRVCITFILTLARAAHGRSCALQNIGEDHFSSIVPSIQACHQSVPTMFRIRMKADTTPRIRGMIRLCRLGRLFEVDEEHPEGYDSFIMSPWSGTHLVLFPFSRRLFSRVWRFLASATS